MQNKHTNENMRPSTFRPASASEMIGSARVIAEAMEWRSRDFLESRDGPLKIIFHGPPGSGKSSIAQLMAKILHNPYANENVNGCGIKLEMLHHWIEEMGTPTLWPTVVVKHIDEINLVRGKLADFMWTVLDRMPKNWVCLATTNQAPSHSAFFTRWQKYEIAAPSAAELLEFLRLRTALLSDRDLEDIVRATEGNVREALNQAETKISLLHYRNRAA